MQIGKLGIHQRFTLVVEDKSAAQPPRSTPALPPTEEWFARTKKAADENDPWFSVMIAPQALKSVLLLA